MRNGEQCDDGNNLSNDGCSSNCQLEEITVCGNGEKETGENCDDGNTVSGDGCSALCTIEIVNNCGDGKTDNLTEECDDGNTLSGDGCSATCKVEDDIIKRIIDKKPVAVRPLPEPIALPVTLPDT